MRLSAFWVEDLERYATPPVFTPWKDPLDRKLPAFIVRLQSGTWFDNKAWWNNTKDITYITNIIWYIAMKIYFKTVIICCTYTFSKCHEKKRNCSVPVVIGVRINLWISMRGLYHQLPVHRTMSLVWCLSAISSLSLHILYLASGGLSND